nr:MAG TPA: hypothetical protein [Caudoviricetes sp.]
MVSVHRGVRAYACAPFLIQIYIKISYLTRQLTYKRAISLFFILY